MNGSVLIKNGILYWYLTHLNPPLKDNCQNHGLIGLLDFTDWELRDLITYLKHFVITHLNPPLKMEDF